MSTRIAFIGLGNMGGPMAANLVKAGYTVTGYDPSPKAIVRASDDGVTMAASPEDAVKSAQVVITMLPTGSHVLSVYRGIDGKPGILAIAPAGTLFIDSSTIAVGDARDAAAAAVAAGHRAIDAPVSGGVGGAAAGTLTFMVGASEADFTDAEPILGPMASRVVRCGTVGAGQAAKICNNMILGISMAAVSEAFVLGERLGVTHQALFDVVSTASGACWALTSNCPVPGPVPTSPANRDYQPGFASALMAKDLGLAMAAAESTNTDTRLGHLTTVLYRELAARGSQPRDFSAIINQIRAAAPELVGAAR